MNKLLLLTLACTYGISMRSMDSENAHQKKPITPALFHMLELLEEKKLTYEKTKKESDDALQQIKPLYGDTLAFMWGEADCKRIECEEQCKKIKEEIATLELQIEQSKRAMESDQPSISSDKSVRTIQLLTQTTNQLSKSLSKIESEYEETSKKVSAAYHASQNKNDPNQEQAKTDLNQYKKQRDDLWEQLAKVEEQIHATKYKWFMNRIKYSNPKDLQDAIPHATGQYKLTNPYNNLYCLFAREQKMKFIAYARTIELERSSLYMSNRSKKLSKKYEDACLVTLLMKEFKTMTVVQQNIANYFEYQEK